jgi:uridine kinase
MRMKIIIITGGSASGKTTFSRVLSKELKNSFVLSQDLYFKDVSHLSQREKMDYNFDLPDSVYLTHLYKNIKELMENGETKIPKYDFVTAKCELEHTLIKSPKYLIIEGIFSLYNPLIYDLNDCTVFVDSEEEVRFKRRLKRDIRERGYNEEEISNSFYKYSKPAYESYILPLKDKCDYIVKENNFDFTIKEIIKKLLKD